MSRTPTVPQPPRPRRERRIIRQLGRERADDYAWMKDDNWREVLRDPSRVKAEVREHLQAENAYCDAVLAPTAALQARLFAEMRGRIKETDASVPLADGAFEYWFAYEAGAQHPRHWRRRRDGGGADELLLDEEAESAGKAFWSVDGAGHSPDHRLWAYAVDETGSEEHRIRIRDLAGGAWIDGPADAAGNFVFSPDGAWLFWVARDENARPSRVYRHPACGGEDVLVYAEEDPGLFVGVEVSADRSHVLIGAHNQETSEVWLIPAADPCRPPVVAASRRDGVRYDLDRWGDRWLIRTNDGGAVDFKIMASRAAVPAADTWQEWTAHRPGRLIAGMVLTAGHMARLEREDACDRIVVVARDGAETPIAFDEEAFALHLSGGYEYETSSLRFVYQSPTTPRQWFDYDMASGARTLRKTQEVPSGHDPSLYETRRLEATAADGARVPVTVLMRRGQALDGSAPVLLYGYGSYGYPSQATFSTQALSLVDRGWIWAIAHVRGGSDKGWGWFLDGRGRKKMNTFTDFIACGDHLAAQGYGRAGRIAAYGGSAGGLLVGAAVNLRPDLFGAVIAAVPFVDVLNTISDASLPLTPPEWPEWGNPIEDVNAYDAIAAYSPYDNVAARPYPAILARAGLSDPRVTWWEPEKWIARLRDHTTSDKPLLLKVNMDAGHGGASGRFDHLKEVALDYAFAIWAIEGEAAL